MKKYVSFTDEELIGELRQGKEELMDYILDKYKPLVRKQANALYLIGGETDDLIQEGMIGLFKAIRDYRTDKDASFFHFARLCITRQMYTAVEAAQRKKHTPLNTYVSFYEDSREDGVPLLDTIRTEERDNPESLLIQQESMEDMISRLKKRLSRMEQQVLDYSLEGLNYHQIAECMGKSPKAIDNALQRIRNKC